MKLEYVIINTLTEEDAQEIQSVLSTAAPDVLTKWSSMGIGWLVVFIFPEGSSIQAIFNVAALFGNLLVARQMKYSPHNSLS